MNAKTANAVNRLECKMKSAEVKHDNKFEAFEARLSRLEALVKTPSERTAADAPDLRAEVTEIRKELKDEVGELKFYLDEELNKGEKKTAERLEEIKSRIADAEEQIVIAQKTAEGSNTTADAPALERLHKRIDGLRHYLDNDVKSYVDTEFFKTNAKLKKLEETAVTTADIEEIPEGVVLDAKPVTSSTGLRASVISDSMSIGEINDVMERLSRHMEDLPASETSAVISMLSETAENIKALLDRLHLR